MMLIDREREREESVKWAYYKHGLCHSERESMKKRGYLIQRMRRIGHPDIRFWNMTVPTEIRVREI